MKKRTIRREKKVYSKSDRAITLIALIVTIIVLLVLAGVTIANVMGNQGSQQITMIRNLLMKKWNYS